jgi:hypothetical protein
MLDTKSLSANNIPPFLKGGIHGRRLITEKFQIKDKDGTRSGYRTSSIQYPESSIQHPASFDH